MSEPGNQGAGEAPVPRAEILVVDDTPINLLVLVELLGSRGFGVLVAIDGESALEQLELVTPDLIILDVMMPGIDGFETCRRIKGDPRFADVPVLFLSAASDTGNKVRGLELGAVDYITKPIQQEEVIARVETHLSLRDLRRELERSNQRLEERVRDRTAELTRLNAAYERFFPREILGQLNRRDITEVAVGDQVEQEMTILFSDIRSFTSLSEQMTPEENFRFLNDYFGRIIPVIRENGGVVDQFLGDGFMALFPGSPGDALKAAVALQSEVARFSREYSSPLGQPVRSGVGIHTGTVMLGVLGEHERMQCTVVSDAVNLASRLEGVTKIYGAAVVVSEATLAGLGEDESPFHCRFVDKVRVYGKEEAVVVHEVLDGDPAEQAALKLESKDVFEAGLERYYAKEFADSCGRFNEVLKRNPEDGAARVYLRRSAHYMIHGVPLDWDGVEALNTK